MRWLTWFDALNLLDVLNYYLILVFLVSTGLRIRSYRAILGFIYGFRNRWPKLWELAKKHRSVFLGWPTLLVIGLAFTLMLSNSLAIRLLWIQAKVSVDDLWGCWLAFVVVMLSGGLMLFLDCKAIFSARNFDRAALEMDLDKAESWLKSWMAPAVRMVTLGFINPRKIVGVEVEKALVEANWIMMGGMRCTSLRIGMQLAFGLSLWLTWAFALRGSPPDESAARVNGREDRFLAYRRVTISLGRDLARLPQVVWHAAYDNSRAVQQGGFQHEHGLIMQSLLPPVRRHELGQKDRHHVLPPGRVHGVYVVNQHADERAVGRRQHLERNLAMEPFPVRSYLGGFGRINLHVDRLHVAG